MAREDDQVVVDERELVTAADSLQVVIRVMVGLQSALANQRLKPLKCGGTPSVKIRACAGEQFERWDLRATYLRFRLRLHCRKLYACQVFVGRTTGHAAVAGQQGGGEADGSATTGQLGEVEKNGHGPTGTWMVAAPFPEQDGPKAGVTGRPPQVPGPRAPPHTAKPVRPLHKAP